MAFAVGATVARDATGNVADIVNGSLAFLNCTTPGEAPLFSTFSTQSHVLTTIFRYIFSWLQIRNSQFIPGDWIGVSIWTIDLCRLFRSHAFIGFSQFGFGTKSLPGEYLELLTPLREDPKRQINDKLFCRHYARISSTRKSAGLEKVMEAIMNLLEAMSLPFSLLQRKSQYVDCFKV